MHREKIIDILSNNLMKDFEKVLFDKFNASNKFKSVGGCLNTNNREDFVKKITKAGFIQASDLIYSAVFDWENHFNGDGKTVKKQCDCIEEILGWLLILCFNENSDFKDINLDNDSEFISIEYISKTPFEAELVYSKILRHCAKFKVVSSTELKGSNQIDVHILEEGFENPDKYFFQLKELLYKEIFCKDIDKNNAEFLKIPEFNESETKRLNARIRKKILRGENFYFTIDHTKLKTFNIPELPKKILNIFPHLSVFIINNQQENQLLCIDDDEIIGDLIEILSKIDSIRMTYGR